MAEAAERLHAKELEQEHEAEVQRERGARARVVMPIPAELILTPVLEPKSCAFRRAAYCPS
jgi:hypothetical protein